MSAADRRIWRLRVTVAAVLAVALAVALIVALATAHADTGNVAQLEPSLPSTPQRDGRFLDALAKARITVTSAPTIVAGAHNACAYLADHHSAEDAVTLAMQQNATLTRADAIAD